MKFRNISGNRINIDCKPIQIDEEFESRETREIKNLIREGYLQRI